MAIVRFARSQQRTLLVAAVALVAVGAFSAGVWLGTQPLPGAGSARDALAAEARPIALVGSNRATTATDSIEMIPTRSSFATGGRSASGGPVASDAPPVPGPADPQDPTPSPNPDPPTGPSPIPIPTEPVVDAVEDALNGVVETVPSTLPLPVPVPTATTPLVGAVTAVTAGAVSLP